jgi:L-methionine (R)-S-oxide reductase
MVISEGVANGVVSELETSEERGTALRRRAMEALSQLPGYDWSGIYRMESGGLVLDEYVGAETEHTQIPVGVGVCGTAVKEDRNVLVDDVRTLDNYLSCSLQTRSEIVVLIRRDGRILGQIDIDGHSVGAFDKTDESFLSRVAEIIASRW